MNIKILSAEDESAMLNLLLSERKSEDTDFYLDRGDSYWGIYNWFSQKKNIGIGVFDNKNLVGIVTLSRLPFLFKESIHRPYLLSDFFVHPEYRKSFVAARIFTGLQKNLPKEDFIHIAIENKYGFAEAIGRFSNKYGNASEWARETNLVILYPNQPIPIDHPKSSFKITDNWGEINTHLEIYRKNSDTWVDWSERIELSNTFKKVWLFQYWENQKSVSGLLIDRGNLQKVRWNGQTRVYIEKFRRALKNKNELLSVDSELPFLNLCFVDSTQPLDMFSEVLAHYIANFGYSQNYFGINFRDLKVPVPANIDHAEFLRRVVISSSSNNEYLKKFIEKNKNRSSMIELVYL